MARKRKREIRVSSGAPAKGRPVKGAKLESGQSQVWPKFWSNLSFGAVLFLISISALAFSWAGCGSHGNIQDKGTKPTVTFRSGDAGTKGYVEQPNTAINGFPNGNLGVSPDEVWVNDDMMNEFACLIGRGCAIFDGESSKTNPNTCCGQKCENTQNCGGFTCYPETVMNDNEGRCTLRGAHAALVASHEGESTFQPAPDPFGGDGVTSRAYEAANPPGIVFEWCADEPSPPTGMADLCSCRRRGMVRYGIEPYWTPAFKGMDGVPCSTPSFPGGVDPHSGIRKRCECGRAEGMEGVTDAFSHCADEQGRCNCENGLVRIGCQATDEFSAWTRVTSMITCHADHIPGGNSICYGQKMECNCLRAMPPSGATIDGFVEFANLVIVGFPDGAPTTAERTCRIDDDCDPDASKSLSSKNICCGPKCLATADCGGFTCPAQTWRAPAGDKFCTLRGAKWDIRDSIVEENSWLPGEAPQRRLRLGESLLATEEALSFAPSDEVFWEPGIVV